jgi:hypothetical protein
MGRTDEGRDGQEGQDRGTGKEQPRPQQHPMGEREVARAVHTSDERGEQLVDVSRFLAKAGQQRAIDVQCQPGFAPSLDGEAADETKAPSARLEKPLELERGREQRVHVNDCGEGIARTRSSPTR